MTKEQQLFELCKKFIEDICDIVGYLEEEDDIC